MHILSRHFKCRDHLIFVTGKMKRKNHFLVHNLQLDAAAKNVFLFSVTPPLRNSSRPTILKVVLQIVQSFESPKFSNDSASANLILAKNLKKGFLQIFRSFESCESCILVRENRKTWQAWIIIISILYLKHLKLLFISLQDSPDLRYRCNVYV